MSTISASTTTTTAYKVTADTTGTLVLQTGSTPTTAVTIDTSQNVGIGTSSPAVKLDVSGRAQFVNSAFNYVLVDSTSSDAYLRLAAAATVKWHFRNNVSNSNALEITPDAGSSAGLFLSQSGNLGVGTTSPSEKLQVAGSIRVTSNASNFNVTGGQVDFITDTTRIAAYNSTGGFVTFYTNASGGNVAEKVRLDPGGNFQVGLTNIASYVGASPVGSIANVASANATNSAAFVHSTTGVPYGPFFYFSGASPNNTTSYFLQCTDTTNSKAFIYSNGTFGSRTSTYGGISDIKVKQDIVDASSQWNDIKALQFRKYRFKDDPTGPLQLGLISQEAELVSPGLVFETPDTTMDEEGNRVETGEFTKSVKYSILYMKAVVALQEAMNRIEQLENRITALEAK